MTVEKFVRSYVAMMESLLVYKPDIDFHYKRVAVEMYEKLGEFDRERMSSIFETVASFNETEEEKDRQNAERADLVAINW